MKAAGCSREKQGWNAAGRGIWPELMVCRVGERVDGFIRLG